LSPRRQHWTVLRQLPGAGRIFEVSCWHQVHLAAAPEPRGITDRTRVVVDRCVQDQHIRVGDTAVPPAAVPGQLVRKMVALGMAAGITVLVDRVEAHQR
jgi:hypothetical protein